MSDPKTERPELPPLELKQEDINRADAMCAADDEDANDRIGPWESLACRERQLLSEIALRQQLEARKRRGCGKLGLELALQAVKDERPMQCNEIVAENFGGTGEATTFARAIRFAEQAIQRLIDAEGK